MLNPIFKSATTEWNMSIDVNAWGQNVAIYRTDGLTLKLGYVAVFATTYDCNRIVLPSTTMAVGTIITYSFALDVACNQIIAQLV